MVWFPFFFFFFLTRPWILGYYLWNLDPLWKVWDHELVGLRMCCSLSATLFLVLCVWWTLDHSAKPWSNVTFFLKPPLILRWIGALPLISWCSCTYLCHSTCHSALIMGLRVCCPQWDVHPLRAGTMFYFRLVVLVLSTRPGTEQVFNASFMNKWFNKYTKKWNLTERGRHRSPLSWQCQWP